MTSRIYIKNVLAACWSGDYFWFRIGGANGPGLVFSKSRLLFSERNGYTKYLSLPLGWRVKFLAQADGG